MNSFEPIHEKHGIYVASIVVILEKPLENFIELSNKIISDQSVLSFHQESRMFKIIGRKNEPTFSEELSNGFVLKSANDNPKQLLHAYNEESQTVVIYQDYEYDKWTPFFKKFKIVFGSFCEFAPSNRAKAMAVEYIDKFTWMGDTAEFKWNKLFREDSGMLSEDFYRHTPLNFRILQERSFRESENSVMEQLEITRESENTASIRHHVSMNLTPKTTTNQPDLEVYYSNLVELHEFNKKILKQLLLEAIIERVGLNK